MKWEKNLSTETHHKLPHKCKYRRNNTNKHSDVQQFNFMNTLTGQMYNYVFKIHLYCISHLAHSQARFFNTCAINLSEDTFWNWCSFEVFNLTETEWPPLHATCTMEVIRHLLEESICSKQGIHCYKYITMDFIHHIKIYKLVTNIFTSFIKLLLINKTLMLQ